MARKVVAWMAKLTDEITRRFRRSIHTPVIRRPTTAAVVVILTATPAPWCPSRGARWDS